MFLVEVQQLSKRFPGGLHINNINFEQQALQNIAIAGESGAGKTTLLKMISGHAQPDSGTILFEGERVIGPDEKLLPGHKHIAYLSQDHDLLHNYKVEELVWFENHLSYEDAATLFKVCQVDHLLKRRTDQLSGGEQQRIALCMLLVKSPKMLILDEPFSNLDLIHKNALKTVLEEITNRLQITCMLTSHDPHDTLSWADVIIVMKDGTIIQQATPQEIYYKPVNEYVAGLFGKYNLLKPHIAALFGIDTKGNTIMARPENFRIYKTGSGVKTIINKVSFWGSFYEVEIAVQDATIIVRSEESEWKAGDKIFVGIK